VVAVVGGVLAASGRMQRLLLAVTVVIRLLAVRVVP
jgi:hypothetical protein